MAEFYVDDVLSSSYSIILGFGGGNAAKLGVIDLPPSSSPSSSTQRSDGTRHDDGAVSDVKVFNGTLS